MTQIELFADMLQRNLERVKATLADFSDADMLVRPAPAANHAAWQLGHLITSEGRFLKEMNAASAPLPAGFAEKFNRQTASTDDPDFFPRKAELLDALTNVRAATIAWIKSLKPADLDRAAPERIRAFAPTVGHWVAGVPGHVFMHIGQMQVVRRKLGKPILF